MSLYKCEMYVSRVETMGESLSFHLITWLPVFNVPQFIAKLVIPPNYRLHGRWRLTREHCSLGLSPPVLSPTSPIAKILVCPDFPHYKYPVILPNSFTAIRHRFSDTKVVKPI